MSEEKRRYIKSRRVSPEPTKRQEQYVSRKTKERYVVIPHYVDDNGDIEIMLGIQKDATTIVPRLILSHIPKEVDDKLYSILMECSDQFGLFRMSVDSIVETQMFYDENQIILIRLKEPGTKQLGTPILAEKYKKVLMYNKQEWMELLNHQYITLGSHSNPGITGAHQRKTLALRDTVAAIFDQLKNFYDEGNKNDG